MRNPPAPAPPPLGADSMATCTQSVAPAVDPLGPDSTSSITSAAPEPDGDADRLAGVASNPEPVRNCSCDSDPGSVRVTAWPAAPYTARPPPSTALPNRSVVVPVPAREEIRLPAPGVPEYTNTPPLVPPTMTMRARTMPALLPAATLGAAKLRIWSGRRGGRPPVPGTVISRPARPGCRTRSCWRWR